jgi:hypothetical protein
MFLAAENHIIYNIKEDETISQHYKHRGTETQSFIVLCVSASLCSKTYYQGIPRTLTHKESSTGVPLPVSFELVSLLLCYLDNSPVFR